MRVTEPSGRRGVQARYLRWQDAQGPQVQEHTGGGQERDGAHVIDSGTMTRSLLAEVPTRLEGGLRAGVRFEVISGGVVSPAEPADAQRCLWAHRPPSTGHGQEGQHPAAGSRAAAAPQLLLVAMSR